MRNARSAANFQQFQLTRVKKKKSTNRARNGFLGNGQRVFIVIKFFHLEK